MNTNNSIEDTIGDVDFDPAELKAKYLFERDKRIRPDTTAQYIEVKAEFSNYDKDPYIEATIEREPLTDKVEVVVIGDGFGSLLTVLSRN